MICTEYIYFTSILLKEIIFSYEFETNTKVKRDDENINEKKRINSNNRIERYTNSN